MKENVNIKDVAKKAGVSIATVSRVFHHSGSVKESTRRRIEEIILETGYKPNVLARELAEKKTRLVGLIVHDMVGEGIPRAVQEVSRSLEEHGFNLLIACSGGDCARELKHLDLFWLKRVEGILFVTRTFRHEHAEFIKRLPIPVVVLLQKTDTEQIPYVAFDNYQFAKEATTRLIELGHVHFAFLGGPLNSVNAVERRQGFVDALLAQDIQPDHALILNGNFYIDDGYNKMQDILAMRKKVTAVVSVNDGMALGAINCLLDAGIKVPEDISVLALDDTVLAKASRLKLSGVHYSYTMLGEEGANLLLKQMLNKKISFEHKIIPYTINMRESVTSKFHSGNITT